MLLGLVMVVKDEALGIEATLRSIKPFINHWTILDTGSTDDTKEIIRRELADIPGTLHEEPFVDFSTTRNRVLRLHGAATTFAIMLSGDDVLTNGLAKPAGVRISIQIDYLRSYLRQHEATRGADVFHVTRTTGTTRYAQAMIVRCDTGWHYVGRTHECLTHLDPKRRAAASMTVPDVAISRARDGDLRSKIARWRKDLFLLQQDLAEGHDVPRSTFYLAQTNELLNDLTEARRLYTARIKLEGWYEERYEAMYRLARVMDRDGVDWECVQQRYLEAHAFAPNRAEPLFEVARRHERDERWSLCYLFARGAADLPLPRIPAFVEPDVYTWRAAELVAMSAWRLVQWGRLDAFEIGRAASQQALRANPTEPRLASLASRYSRTAPDVTSD